MSVDDPADRRHEGDDREVVTLKHPRSGARTERRKCSDVERLRAELAAMPDERWTAT
jgi:hypothetical protein